MVGTFLCGPGALAKVLAKKCAKYSDVDPRKTKFYFNKENFWEQYPNKGIAALGLFERLLERNFTLCGQISVQSCPRQQLDDMDAGLYNVRSGYIFLPSLITHSPQWLMYDLLFNLSAVFLVNPIYFLITWLLKVTGNNRWLNSWRISL